MNRRRKLLSSWLAGAGGALAAFALGRAQAQDQAVASPPAPGPAGANPPAAPSPAALPLFAVELRTGARWDHTRPAHEQAHFREHSANLKRLRDQGHIVLGARYSDKGFLVVAGATATAVRELMEADPSIQAQVFAFDLHEFRVFYPGCVSAPARRT
ncbi:MAG: hypothetical protein IPO58_22875 [Betaproteobacteria bacterium]|nr:hypothetical protein [Betaproteobacteria bacterium]